MDSNAQAGRDSETRLELIKTVILICLLAGVIAYFVYFNSITTAVV